MNQSRAARAVRGPTSEAADHSRNLLMLVPGRVEIVNWAALDRGDVVRRMEHLAGVRAAE